MRKSERILVITIKKESACIDTCMYSLKEVSAILGKKPYQITYAIVTGKVPDVRDRLAGKRVFLDADLVGLRAHFVQKREQWRIRNDNK